MNGSTMERYSSGQSPKMSVGKISFVEEEQNLWMRSELDKALTAEMVRGTSLANVPIVSNDLHSCQRDPYPGGGRYHLERGTTPEVEILPLEARRPNRQ